ncbi:MAG: bifunctional metallophosphatase/5'-nucleotidase [Sphingomicrobium sp.]
MTRSFSIVALGSLLAACAAPQVATRPATHAPIEVQILAFNDFHGNLETPVPVEITGSDGVARTITTGGVAHLAAALAARRHGASITVSAGDLIGASPFVSATFLDEPTIAAMNLVGLDLNAVGNHEFDKGTRELWRMQAGGCAKFTKRMPCRLEPFTGAKFRFLAANVRTADGVTLFAPTALRQFGAIRIGFIGMTLRGTKDVVTPSGVAGVTFADEAATANALVPTLKAQGADTIVLLIHQGGRTPAFTDGQGCDGLSGDILPILDKLDPAIATIVSGHTHYAYVCQRGGRLLTSAGKYGYLFSDLRLAFDASSHRLIAQRATNLLTGTGAEDPTLSALVARYAAAAAPEASRVVGHLAGPASRDDNDGESAIADLIADALRHAARSPAAGGAGFALINGKGVRVGLTPAPDGSVTYGQIFSVMPFGNGVVTLSLSGAQVKALLEQQFREPRYASGAGSALLVPSANLTFAYDLRRSPGSRVTDIRLDGRPILPGARYRVATNNFLASGGDGFSVFAEGTNPIEAGFDIDAMAAWLAKGQRVPTVGRTRNLTR